MSFNYFMPSPFDTIKKDIFKDMIALNAELENYLSERSSKFPWSGNSFRNQHLTYLKKTLANLIKYYLNNLLSDKQQPNENAPSSLYVILDMLYCSNKILVDNFNKIYHEKFDYGKLGRISQKYFDIYYKYEGEFIPQQIRNSDIIGAHIKDLYLDASGYDVYDKTLKTGTIRSSNRYSKDFSSFIKEKSQEIKLLSQDKKNEIFKNIMIETHFFRAYLALESRTKNCNQFFLPSSHDNTSVILLIKLMRDCIKNYQSKGITLSDSSIKDQLDFEEVQCLKPPTSAFTLYKTDLWGRYLKVVFEALLRFKFMNKNSNNFLNESTNFGFVKKTLIHESKTYILANYSISGILSYFDYIKSTNADYDPFKINLTMLIAGHKGEKENSPTGSLLMELCEFHFRNALDENKSKKDIIKHVAYFSYYYPLWMPFLRGSAAVGEAIAKILLLSRDIPVSVLKPRTMLDIFALVYDSVDDYATDFHTFFDNNLGIKENSF